MTWHVYLLECGDGTLYCGVTNDVAKRLAAHREGTGAKYTRGRGPLRLAWKKSVKSRSEALKLEARVKRLPRAEKLRLALTRPRARRRMRP